MVFKHLVNKVVNFVKPKTEVLPTLDEVVEAPAKAVKSTKAKVAKTTKPKTAKVAKTTKTVAAKKAKSKKV